MKLFNAKLLKYELKSQIKNWYVPFFGLIFPTLLSQLIVRNALGDVPAQILPVVHIQIYFTMLVYIPLCCVFLSHSYAYGYDVEKEIPLRMKLFGISKATQISCRLQSILIISTLALIIFSSTFFTSFAVPKTSAKAIIVSLLFFYVLCISLFLLAHSLALIIRRSEATGGLSMGIYFFFLFISGGLGMDKDMMPKALQTIASIFPFYHISESLGEYFYKDVNLAPLVQSTVFFLLLCIGMLYIGLHQEETRR